MIRIHFKGTANELTKFFNWVELMLELTHETNAGFTNNL